MSLLREIRKAVIGETWELPVLVAALVGVAVTVKATAGALWEDAGGALLLGGAVAILLAVVLRTR